MLFHTAYVHSKISTILEIVLKSTKVGKLINIENIKVQTMSLYLFKK